MLFANVHVGSIANDGTGDPLRNAFETINQNFANISTLSATAPVQSVAGRGGNVTLTVNDVLGAVSIGYTTEQLGNLQFTMANSQNWTSNVSTVSAALNQLAARLKAAGH
jgi:hypothetical protein